MNGLYERYTYRGVTLDRFTIAAFHAAEKRLGYANRIIQGSYHGGVSASGGTHDGGGAADLVWADIRRKTRAFRGPGCSAGYPREAIPGVWDRHFHLIVLGDDKASPAAKAQMAEYRAGGDGLVGSTPDRRWRPRRIRNFSYRRAGLVSWKRLNAIAAAGGKPTTGEGQKQVQVVARALEGFGMSLGGHVPGRMDKPLIDAIGRFATIRKVGETDVAGPVTPKLLWELCIPSREDRTS